jgi:nucleoid DNA-binding protein
MSIAKKDIIYKIVKDVNISNSEASSLLESFLQLIKLNAKNKTIKLSNFGSFAFKKTPERVGRNPKTRESYIIDELSKLNFKPSEKVKGTLN